MVLVFVRHSCGSQGFELPSPSVQALHQHVKAFLGVPKKQQRITYFGRNIVDDAQFTELSQDCSFVTVDLSLRLLGGKGGFGSLLRSARSVKKTTNFGACRDRHGNRLRDIEVARRMAQHELDARNPAPPAAPVVVSEPEPPIPDPVVVAREQKYQEARKEIIANVVSSVSESYVLSLKKKKEERSLKRKREATELGPLWDNDLADIEEEEEEVKEEKVENVEVKVNLEKEASETIKTSTTVFTSHISTNNNTTNNSTSTTTTSNNLTNNTASSSNTTLPPAKEHKPLDLQQFSSLAELEAVDPDTLKLDLQLRKMKCGGTPAQRAQRLWSVRDLTEIPANLLAGPAKAPPKKRRRV